MRIVANPFPEIFASIFKREFCLPVELLVCACRIGSQIQNIARSSLDDVELERLAGDLAECVNHLKDSAAASRSKVPCSDTRLLLSEVVEGCEMTLGEIDYVDVITNGGTVSGRVVYC